MAPRRSVKNVYVPNNINYNNLILNDVLCPICRSILIEPVTLPCNHGFCSSCFEGTVANANLVCPLCRVRIGSWLRTSKKCNKLINLMLWEAIQKHFPNQVKNKLDGNEEYLIEDIPKLLSTAGEIRREYELQKSKEDSELAREREAEAKISEAYIRSLKEQEDSEEAQRVESLRMSEEVAKKLAEEYSFDPGPSTSSTSVAAPIKKQGPIDLLLKNMKRKNLDDVGQPSSENIGNKQYTCKILCQKQNNTNKGGFLNWKLHDKFKKIKVEGEASDSNDSIDSECLYFKPIEPCVPLPRKVSIIKVPAKLSKAATVIIRPPTGEIIVSYFINSAFAKYSPKVEVYRPYKRKVSEGENEKNPKRKAKVKESPSLQLHTTDESQVNSPPCYGFSPVPNNVDGTTKMDQEEEDLKLAKQLHQEMNGCSRRSTRNSINEQYNKVKKSQPRQTTLKEIITQSVGKVSKL